MLAREPRFPPSAVTDAPQEMMIDELAPDTPFLPAAPPLPPEPTVTVSDVPLDTDTPLASTICPPQPPLPPLLLPPPAPPPPPPPPPTTA